MKIEHGPIRSCIVCRQRSEKSSLLRIVADFHGRVLPDLRQLKPGRGAYICRRSGCIQRLKDKHLHAAWRKCTIAGSQSNDLLGRLQKSFEIIEVNV